MGSRPDSSIRPTPRREGQTPATVCGTGHAPGEGLVGGARCGGSLTAVPFPPGSTGLCGKSLLSDQSYCEPKIARRR